MAVLSLKLIVFPVPLIQVLTLSKLCNSHL